MANIKTHTFNEIIEIFGDPFQSEELHIHLNEKEYTESPIAYPFRLNNFAILLVLSGEIEIQLNLLSYPLKKNEVLVISPNTVSQVINLKGKVKILAISFTYDFVLKNCFKNSTSFQFLVYDSLPKFMLEKKEVDTFKRIALFLQENNIKTNKMNFENEIIYHSFNLLMYQLATIYHKNKKAVTTSSSRNEEISLRFIKILKENYTSERNVQFYADVLSVTRGHLSKVLKQISGKTAKQVIENVIIMESKILLANPSKTISQISDELNFSDQSFFGKYFKKYTGISPTLYRKHYLAK